MYTLALLFSGHMVDLPGRAEPRFPEPMVSLADDVIKARIAALSESVEGSLVGIAGAARGGDLLFLDACRDLGLDTRIVLPEPLAAFIANSVAGVPGSDWEDRFAAIWNAHTEREREVATGNGTAKVSKEDNIYERCNRRMFDLARKLGKAQHLLTFWNGKAGDGPGGTAAYARMAVKAGGTFERIEAERLLAVYLGGRQ